ncbi:cyclohexanecarboxylate-CoA ligase [Brevibacterium aurantiacum]|uniref:Cyclohexanecarboxylate-CoA ligase n=2 Tax=Brevibacterium aurantiacum TaxID=273384 RepID=A0A4Z0KIB4_BREAU|nr:cyclohexanecarboxylate-CoA ligase [Brevibacterium aurantiacum]
MAEYEPTLRERFTTEQIERYYATGNWTEDSFSDTIRKQAQKRPDKVYCLDSTHSLTFAELYEQVQRLAVGLKRLGVQRGDRVLAQVPNLVEFPVIAGAAARIGAVIVPVMPIYRGNDVEYVLSNSGAKVAFFADEFNKFSFRDMYLDLFDEVDSLEHLVALRPVSGADDSKVHNFRSLLAEGDLEALEAEAGPDTHPDEPYEIVYTSGTTSRPKGCYHTLNTVRSGAVQLTEVLQYTEDDKQFGPSPITHTTGIVTSVFLPLLNGATSYFMEKWDPAEGVRIVEEQSLTCAVTATAFLQGLMRVYDPDVNNVDSLRVWVSAGAPVPGSLVRNAEKLIPRCSVQSLYGRSENNVTTVVPLGEPAEKSINSDGGAISPADVKVVGADGYEVSRGAEGDIAYKGPSHMLGYWHNEPETELLFTPEGYSRSGDLGFMNDEGYVRVTGRSKDIIIRGGMNISAREVEDYLIEFPDVANVAVVAMPDEKLGEKCCAYVVPAADGTVVDLQTVTDYLRRRGVTTQKLPERVEVVAELPTTATGKIQKHILRAEIAAKLKSDA